jgi:hypothetical protein
MFKRRRRRSSFSRRSTASNIPVWAPIIVGVAALIGLMIFFIRQADVLAPEPTEISVPLPDAFKDQP